MYRFRLLTASAGLAVAVGAAAWLATATAAASLSNSRSSVASAVGFRAAGVTCAVRLPRLAAGLYCAAGGVKRGAYDGRGIARLTPDDRALVVRAGNDLLLAIDGDLPRSARPALRTGGTWSLDGYRCVAGTSRVRCKRLHQGFVISRTGFSIIR